MFGLRVEILDCLAVVVKFRRYPPPTLIIPDFLVEAGPGELNAGKEGREGATSFPGPFGGPGKRSWLLGFVSFVGGGGGGVGVGLETRFLRDDAAILEGSLASILTPPL